MKKKLSKAILQSMLLLPFLAACADSGSSFESLPVSSEEPTTSEHSSELPSESSSETSSESSIESTSELPPEPYVGPEADPVGTKAREAIVKDESPTLPSNVTDEASFKKLGTANLSEEGTTYSIRHGELVLRFVLGADGYDVSIDHEDTPMFEVKNPVKAFVRYQEGTKKQTIQMDAAYSSVELTNYGISAKGTIACPKGTVLNFEDKYYIPTLKVSDAINIERNISVTDYSLKELGFESIYAVKTLGTDISHLEYFVPNNVFGTFTNPSETQKYQYYRETTVGMPMVMMRDAETGYVTSIARYQPVIDYSSGSYASVSVHNGETSSGEEGASIEVTYPSRDSARHYFDPKTVANIVYKMSIQGFVSTNYEEAMVNAYNNQFILQDQRILDIDIDQMYDYIGEDSKAMVRRLSNGTITTYGLPCELYMENGEFGSKSYQAGFTGQQIPMAYHMLLYGVKHNDADSIQNGINVLNFWVRDAGMICDSGVPMIWYEGGQCRWMGYPTFTRMAADAMEGLLDAYRVALAHDLSADTRELWHEAVVAAAEWMVRCQNSDGSWYRCYNYNGTYYDPNNESSGVTWDPGNVARSSSKTSTTMFVRFLGKMYEMTGEDKYLQSIIKAGDFILQELYGRHYWVGGTCDNPDSIDKEAGVFAMYAFDTLYTLTGEQKYLDALEEATIFTMSTVLVPSFKIDPTASDAKVASPLKSGYCDGMSFITCNHNGIDNYAAFIYYELFRVYAFTGKEAYFREAEFIQQNTKGATDYANLWDYRFRSLIVEASTIATFGFDTVGNWLPWCTDANADPIARMYDNFGVADVGAFRDTPIEELRSAVMEFGVGGHAHRVFAA